MGQVPENAYSLIKKWEGFRSKPYRCPAGVWTIGYGTTWLREGVPVTQDTPEITEEDAVKLAEFELEACQRSLLNLDYGLVAYPETLGALDSFVYNLGIGRYKASTLRRKVIERDWDGAKLEIKKWVWGGGKRLPGLVLRRAEEAEYLGK